MVGPKKTDATLAHAAEIQVIRDRQTACLRGEITETDYNNFCEKEVARLVSLGVQAGMVPAFVKDGEPSLTK